MAAPAFVKNPKFIGATIIVLWVAYVVYWNYRLEPINIQLFPFIKPAQLSVSSVIISPASILPAVIAASTEPRLTGA